MSFDVTDPAVGKMCSYYVLECPSESDGVKASSKSAFSGGSDGDGREVSFKCFARGFSMWRQV